MSAVLTIFEYMPCGKINVAVPMELEDDLIFFTIPEEVDMIVDA